MHCLVNILPLVLQDLGMKKKYKIESISVYWHEIVGEEIANHACPKSVQRGLLFVAVDSSAWSHHLSMIKEDMIEKINGFLGEKLIDDIKFHAGYLKNFQNEDNINGEEEISLVKQLKKIRLNQDELNQAVNISENVTDENLRQKVNRVVQRHLALKKLKQLNNWPRCQSCGIFCQPGTNYCTSCQINKKQEKIGDIYKILLEAPWLKYQEIKKYIDCSFSDFVDVRRVLTERMLFEIGHERTEKIKILTLIMLTTGLKPEEITDDIVDRTVEQVRRKKNVFTSRR